MAGVCAGFLLSGFGAWAFHASLDLLQGTAFRDVRVALVVVLLCGVVSVFLESSVKARESLLHRFDAFVFRSALTLGALGAALIFSTLAGALLPFGLWLLWAAAAILVVPLCAWGADRIRARLARPPRPRNTVIVCAGVQGRRLAEWLRRNAPDSRILGFFEDRKDRIEIETLPGPCLGAISEALAWCRANAVERVFVALPGLAENRIAEIVGILSELPVEIYLSPDLPALGPGAPDVARISGAPALRLSVAPITGWRALVKRAEDIVGALVALAVFSPFFIALPILIRLESPGPALFRQKRYGLGGREFDFLKFRSMYIEHCAQEDIKLTERKDGRVTRIGNFIRRTSLDELPQFLNVLKGDMSLVGPRPHPRGVKAGERTYEEVIAEFARRYRVKPGITGLAQVSGARGNTFTEEDLRVRFAYDMEYIQNWSLWLDIKILLNTVVKGFTGKNAF